MGEWAYVKVAVIAFCRRSISRRVLSREQQRRRCWSVRHTHSQHSCQQENGSPGNMSREVTFPCRAISLAVADLQQGHELLQDVQQLQYLRSQNLILLSK